MLRTLLQIERSFYADRQEEAPLLKEREAFLEHLLQQGTSPAAARGVSWQLLNVIRLLQLTELRDVWIDEIKEAAQRWERQQRTNSFSHSYKHSASFFIYVAKKWLRFAGVLKQRAIPRMRFSDQIADFVRWAAEERGLSALTVRSHRHKITLFLKWFSDRRRSLIAYGSGMWMTSCSQKELPAGAANLHVVTPTRCVAFSAIPSNAAGASRASPEASSRPRCINMRACPKGRNGRTYSGC